MGACSAPISHLLPHSLRNPNRNLYSSTHQGRNPNETIIVSSKVPTAVIRRRQLLLFSVPISLTIPIGSAVASFDPVSSVERDASIEVSRRVAEAVELLERGRELQAQGDFNQALQYFTQVVKNYKDLALSDYARVGRAIALYEVGDKDEAIAEMEDVSISLKGYPVKSKQEKGKQY